MFWTELYNMLQVVIGIGSFLFISAYILILMSVFWMSRPRKPKKVAK